MCVLITFDGKGERIVGIGQENRLTFGEVIGKSRVSCFLTNEVYTNIIRNLQANILV